MSNFDEAQVRRGQPDNAGQFRDHQHANPESSLPAPVSDADKAIEKVCTEAGYPGVMPGIFGVLQDRADEQSQLAGILENLTAEDVSDGYDEHIGAAVDDIDDNLERAGTRGRTAAPGPVMDHVKAVCEEAGLGGVMPGMYEVVLERHEQSGETSGLLSRLDAMDVLNDYNAYVGPAIDSFEDDLAQSHCSECGASLADGEGYDGLCGSCADQAENTGRWA